MRHRTEKLRRTTLRRLSYAALFAGVRGVAYALGSAAASTAVWWLTTH